VLTAHGLNMLVFWIIFFEIAVRVLLRLHAAALPAGGARHGLAAFWLMIIGALVNNVAVFRGDSRRDVHVVRADGRAPGVLLGLILFAVGALIACFVFFGTLVVGRTEKTYNGSVPLVTFGARLTAAIIAVSRSPRARSF